MNRSLITLIFLAFCLATPIPSKKPGFTVGNIQARSQLDIFLDPHCPMSKIFYFLLKDVLLAKVNDKPLIEQVTLVVHYQPLPYHQNSILSIKVLKFFEKNHREAVFPFLELMFNKIDDYNAGGVVKSQAELKNALLIDAVSVLGKDVPDLGNVFKSLELEIESRMSFKHAVSRGATGAPFVFLNDVLMDDVPESRDQFIELLTKYI